MAFSFDRWSFILAAVSSVFAIRWLFLIEMEIDAQFFNTIAFHIGMKARIAASTENADITHITLAIHDASIAGAAHEVFRIESKWTGNG